jgi:hypothetical protein
MTLNGCATHRITSEDDGGLVAAVRRDGPGATIGVIKANRHPYEGFQCFEPYMFVVTLGLIPIHCVHRYKASLSLELASSNEIPEAEYKISTIIGWAAPVVTLFPGWRWGSSKQPEVEIEALVRNRGK